MGYREMVMADAPVGFWPLDEAAGTTAYDYSGNDFHGTYFNGPKLDGEALNEALSATSPIFNGQDQYVTVPYHAELAPTAGITIELLVKTYTLQGTFNGLVTKHASGGWDISCHNYTDIFWYIQVNGTGGGLKTLNVPLNMGELAFMTFTFDGNNLRAYKNGQLVTEITNANPLLISYFYSNPLNFAAGAGSTGAFTGECSCCQLSHISIYNYALTEQRISDRYAAMFKTITGAINESLAATLFYIHAFLLKNGRKVGDALVGAGNFSLPVMADGPVIVTALPKYGSQWFAGTSYAVDDLIMPTDPETTPYYYKRLAVGTSASTEPTWPTTPGATVDDNGVSGAWECVERMVQPITQGPLIPV